MVPLMRMTFPSEAAAAFHDDLAMVLSIPRFAERVPAERRGAVRDSRIIFFGRRATDNQPLDVLIDPAGEHAVEDIARLYNVDPRCVHITPQSTLTYNFTARMHGANENERFFYETMETLLNCYAAEAWARVGRERFQLQRERLVQGNELLLPVRMSGDARTIANAYTSMPNYVRAYPGAFLTSDALFLDP